MRARVRVNKTKLSRPGNREEEEEEEEQTANTLEAPSIRLRGTLPSSFRSAILQAGPKVINSDYSALLDGCGEYAEAKRAKRVPSTDRSEPTVRMQRKHYESRKRQRERARNAIFTI